MPTKKKKKGGAGRAAATLGGSGEGAVGPSRMQEPVSVVTPAEPVPVARPLETAAAARPPGPAPAARPPGPAPTARPPEPAPAARPPGPAPIEAVEQVVKGIEQLPLSTLGSTLIVRPNFGTFGRKIALIANHFLITVPDGEIHHYDVAITLLMRSEATSSSKAPDKKKLRALNSKINRKVIQEFIRGNEKIFQRRLPAYDGQKNLMTAHPLPINTADGFTAEVVLRDPEDGNREEKFKVTIKHAADINLYPLQAVFEGRSKVVPQDAIMALDIVLRHGPSFTLTPVGRSFFMGPQNGVEIHPLSGGKDIWFGYHQSLRPGRWKTFINVDQSATTFYRPGPVLDFLCDLFNVRLQEIRELRESDIHILTKELKNVQVRTTHFPRKYRIFKVTKETARRLTFKMEENGKQVSVNVVDYFKMKYKTQLRYPNLPCLQMHPQKKNVYLPLEMCHIIEGQPSRRKLTEIQTSEMIKKTATGPQERFKAIQQAVRQTMQASEPYLKEFGIRIDPQPLKLEGRVLDPPTVVYASNKPVKPREGSWDLRGVNFFRAVNIEKWILLSMASPNFCRQDTLERFAGMLCSIGKQVGMCINQPLDIRILQRNENIRTVLRGLKQQHRDLKLVVIVLGRGSGIYEEIKHEAEVQVGLITQCIKEINVVKKCNPQLVGNLLQKINTKVGGINNSLLPQEKPSVFSKPVIIIGVDVSHPGPSEHKPSIAACVGSMDSHPSRYAVTVRVQKCVEEGDGDDIKPRVEVVLDLVSMIKELLKSFFRITRHKPEKIIIYRDGVSEGQFVNVRNQEVSAVQKACNGLEQGYEPGITYIVVQKRHHTRFAPQNFQEGVGRHKNIPPGTTVDSFITHPVEFDFFLCSHFGIQGTSKPSHYYVLWDDSNFHANDLQKLTYHLCHTYSRCTRSVSVPAPVAYAHLAAFRARTHIASQSDMSSSGSDITDDSRGFAISPATVDAARILEEMKMQMFYV